MQTNNSAGPSGPDRLVIQHQASPLDLDRTREGTHQEAMSQTYTTRRGHLREPDIVVNGINLILLTLLSRPSPPVAWRFSTVQIKAHGWPPNPSIGAIDRPVSRTSRIPVSLKSQPNFHHGSAVPVPSLKSDVPRYEGTSRASP